MTTEAWHRRHAIQIAAALPEDAEDAQVRLRAPRENGDHVVFLEDGLTLEAFLQFVDALPIKRDKADLKPPG
jgi:hypothetical protein